MTDIFDCVMIAGIEVDIVAECDVIKVDDSFSHAFGVERCHHYEVETIYEPSVDGDVAWYVERDLEARDIKRNRRFYKMKRQLIRAIERELANCNPDDLFSESAKDKAIERASD